MVRHDANVVADVLDRVMCFFSEIVMSCDVYIVFAEVVPQSLDLLAIHSSIDVRVKLMLFVISEFARINFPF